MSSADAPVSSADVPVRDAATVVLLRDGDAGPEAWLLERRTSLVFAGGMTVFPGGRVEPSDASVPVAGSLVHVAAGFGCAQVEARALVAGAARETFEETGVLLTRPAADLSAVRADVEAGRVAFGDELTKAGVAVDASLLVPWARWVTPVGEVRRYDTRFFLAALPPRAQAADVTSESSTAAWVPVAEALAQADRGERAMLPPTRVTLGSLQEYGSVAEALSAAGTRDLAPVRPSLARDADGSAVVTLPSGERARLPR